MRFFKISAVFLGVTLFFVGCSTTKDVVEDAEKGKGTTEVYAVPYDVAWEIAMKSFRCGGSDAIEEHRDEGYMLTSSGMNLVSYGAVMGAWLEKITDESTKVTVITKRRIKVNLATTLREKTFHKIFRQLVNGYKRDGKIPSSCPD